MPWHPGLNLIDTVSDDTNKLSAIIDWDSATQIPYGLSGTTHLMGPITGGRLEVAADEVRAGQASEQDYKRNNIDQVVQI